ncbi:RNase adapter RapZ [Salinibacterium sp. NSLL150]|uniref:RNase adapter RapZ n=1 Tax=unclassified Salinibacterium TaxID=2632331 RepID=UPI0018CCB352|nr:MULTISPECIES: RNase adapter RapZ [unclassified Salinibacterium]MBH0024144.1 RNase adapter RapZ [Salinibacterium sp. SWN248]MBH0099109.1 RNase adapter RapZ [Salinibacterium sp. NSLL35]MBH0101863.1 RNase adapter RapZ [Salinibacterium sp. NSLL150]MBH0104623.1 RNase adapter RapZ [Salinibacterium sp. NSLL16]MBH0107383.1 RNase adapter RapZ [Salinibacterium sp. NSLL17]
MKPVTEQQEVLIVTGMSGAGRSTVGNALEDLGWYVVDNLPPQMLLPLVDLAHRAGDSLPRVAAVIDVRGGKLFSDAQHAIEALRASTSLRVLFLDAEDAALVRRFEQVRRPHPLQDEGTPLDGIAAERTRMAEIRSSSDIIIDTTDLNIHQLAMTIIEKFSAESDAGLRITIESFGFKYGLPADADMVADCRFLPNPFWVPELKALDGLDERVRAYVVGAPGAQEFVADYARALEPVFAGYQRENKRHATIAIGCTGGKHRSVAIAEELSAILSGLPGVAVSIKHRDRGRE